MSCILIGFLASAPLLLGGLLWVSYLGSEAHERNRMLNRLVKRSIKRDREMSPGRMRCYRYTTAGYQRKR